MDNKANAHIHMLLDALAYECGNVIGDYRYAKRNVWSMDAKEFALSNIEETYEDIDKAVDVFEYADMMSCEERKVCMYCANTMRREAKKMLRDYMKGEQE